jgi:signal transduction histidine kinase
MLENSKTQPNPIIKHLRSDLVIYSKTETTNQKREREDRIRDVRTSHTLLLPLFNFHSALVTLMSNSSSLTGIQLVRTFIAFSKSESRRISLVPSISAALVA